MTSMIDISIEIWFKLFINADNIYEIILNMETHEVEYQSIK